MYFKPSRKILDFLFLPLPSEPVWLKICYLMSRKSALKILGLYEMQCFCNIQQLPYTRLFQSCWFWLSFIMQLFLKLSFSSTYLTPHVRSRSERSKQWVAHKQASKARAVWCAIHRPKQLLYYALLLLHAARGGGGASVAAARARYSASTAAACTGLNLTVFWQQAVREDGAFTLKVLNSVSTLVICFYYES